ncbi:MAG: PAC2 family protein, partial [Candidatus Thorarchaeota archaeon]
MSTNTFKLVIENENAFSSPENFISGFHGLGSVGYISIKHIIDELKLERIAVLKSSAAPPFISLTENNCLALAFEFYATKDYRSIFFFPRLPPYRHLETEFSDKLSDWV